MKNDEEVFMEIDKVLIKWYYTTNNGVSLRDIFNHYSEESFMGGAFHNNLNKILEKHLNKRGEWVGE